MTTVDAFVPCYEYGRYLRDAVTSILTQRIEALRVLIIDNGSTDNSLDVARQLAKEDKRVQVASHSTNQGQVACYNEGLDWASADYFLVLDADDVLAPGCLRRAVSFMEQNHNVSFTCGTEIEMHFEEGMRSTTTIEPDSPSWHITKGQKLIETFCRNPVNTIGATTVVRRTSMQKKIGHYREGIPHANDFEIWLRLATVGDVARTTAVQGIRRVHTQQLTEAYRVDPTRGFAALHTAFQSFFAHEGNLLPNARRLDRIAKQNLAKKALWYGLFRLAESDERNGKEVVQFALSLDPAVTVPRLLRRIWQFDRPLARLRELAGPYFKGLRPDGRDPL